MGKNSGKDVEIGRRGESKKSGVDDRCNMEKESVQFKFGQNLGEGFAE